MYSAIWSHKHPRSGVLEGSHRTGGVGFIKPDPWFIENELLKRGGLWLTVVFMAPNFTVPVQTAADEIAFATVRW